MKRIAHTRQWRGRASLDGERRRVGRLSQAPRLRAGFTLLELLTVVSLMIIIMGIGTASFVGYTRDAALRAAVSDAQGVIRLARQHAITYQIRTAVTFDQSGERPRMIVYAGPQEVEANRIHTANPIPDGTRLVAVPARIEFTADGTTPPEQGEVQVVIGELRGDRTRTLAVHALTGWVREL